MLVALAGLALLAARGGPSEAGSDRVEVAVGTTTGPRAGEGPERTADVAAASARHLAEHAVSAAAPTTSTALVGSSAPPASTASELAPATASEVSGDIAADADAGADGGGGEAVGSDPGGAAAPAPAPASGGAMNDAPAPVPSGGAAPPAGAPVIALAPGANAQQVVDQAPEGAVIVLQTGVHPLFAVQPRRGQFFLAEPGAVLDGGGVLDHAFYAIRDGHPTPDDVVISGASPSARLEIRHYVGRLQTGAVHPHVDTRPELGMGRNWTVQWCDIHSNRASGIRTADGMTIRGNVVHHNGQLGIGGTGDGVRVVGNEVAYNRTRDDVDPTWEGGGVKLVGTVGALVEGNVVYANRGSGLWTDIDAVGTVVVGNRVYGNDLAGIFDEISYGAEIRDNVVTGNGLVDSGWYWNAGIQLAASRNVVVSGNQLSGNRQGIVLIQQQRGAGSQGVYALDRIRIEGNTVTDSGVTGAVRDTNAFDPFSADIVFQGNGYYGSSAGNFIWNDTTVDTGAWQAAGHDR